MIAKTLWPLVVSLLLLTSCQTSPPAPSPRPEPVPVAWPAFPDPAGQVTEKDGVVSMPVEYWLALTRYVIDAEAARELYEAERSSR